MPLDPRDLDNLRIFAAGAASAIPRARATVGALLAEVDRLQSGGCARDQRTTQFCAEAVAKDVEIRRLTVELANRRPTFDWKESNNVYTARKGIFLLTVSSEGYRLDALDFEDEPFPYPVACGPETGEAGREECEAAYLRAIGTPRP